MWHYAIAGALVGLVRLLIPVRLGAAAKPDTPPPTLFSARGTLLSQALTALRPASIRSRLNSKSSKERGQPSGQPAFEVAILRVALDIKTENRHNTTDT